MGDRFPSADPEAVFDELRRASAGGVADYAGITWERIDRHQGMFWPCPSEDHPGTPRLFTEGFPTSDGRARFHAVRLQRLCEPVSDEYPLVLTTGRIAPQYQSGNQTRRVPSLVQVQPEAFVELHPFVAGGLGVGEGD